MRSIYHTKAATAEELRTELIAELERRIAPPLSAAAGQ